MNLLSRNDLDAPRNAMRRMECIEREVSLGDYKVRVTTKEEGYPWKVAMIVRLETWDKRLRTSQYFESVEEMEVSMK